MRMKMTYGAAFAAMLLSVLSCEERHPDNFADIDSIYFNNRGTGNVLIDSTDVTFVYEPLDEVEMEVPVTVQLLGRAAGHDRQVTVTVSSDNAVEGVDYRIPAPEDTFLPAGEYSFDYVVTLLRTDALESGKKSLTLELHENEDFTLALTELEQTSDTASTVRFTIGFSDMFTTAPEAWEEDILGEFSQAKFDLICKVLSIDPDDFNDVSVMTLPKQMYILEEIKSYIDDESAKMSAGQEFDEDILDPETGNPIKFE